MTSHQTKPRTKLHSIAALFTLTAAVMIGWQSSAIGAPYRRALVVAGGGVSPAVVLGMIDGAKAMGWNPDVVITTCGSSIGSAIANSYRGPGEAIEFAKSKAFHEIMLGTDVELRNLVVLNRRMDKYIEGGHLPDMFNRTVMNLDENMRFLPKTKFTSEGNMRFVVVASRANFDQRSIGANANPSFTQTYFTDPETAVHLRGQRSATRRMFPNSFLDSRTQVIDSARPEDAARGGVADPFLLNPGKIGNSYYFTGASDLFPIETAQALADEVLVTYPETLFKDFEDNIIKRSFGFSQNTRTLATLHFKDVKWIDVYGLADLKLNPRPLYVFLQLMNGISSDFETFRDGIQKQYDFGRLRVTEALRAAPGKKRNERRHLRAPINPNLYYAFTCANANAWKTRHKNYCTGDDQPGCNRERESSCTPIR